MLGMLNTDNYTSLHYNPKTGVNSREWIRYADNTFEPVRRFGSVNRKSRNKPGAPDWWVTERPLDWDPRDNGYPVTLNHNYEKMRAANAGAIPPKDPDKPTRPVVPPTEQPTKPDKPIVPPTEQPDKPKEPLKPGEEPPSRFDRLFSLSWRY